MEISPCMTSSPLFRDIAPADLASLLDCLDARERAYEKGAWLLRRGEWTDRLGLVLSGTVHILREDFWGSRSIVGLAGPGEILAESYALAGEPLEVSVLAASDARVLFLRAEPALTGCGQLTRTLTALLAEKNLALTREVRHMARRTTREKLLGDLSAQALRSGGPEFDIPMDRQQLADYLAVDRSAMSAALGKLRDEGVLEFRKNHFRLLEPGEQDL